ncbi:MAG: hypothetical protein J5881_03525, partial [Clostridia bacterium]|nr:hypothetical protein [Clostridia bacterium]
MDNNFVDYYISKDNKKVLIVNKENIQINEVYKEKFDVIYLNGILEIANQIIKTNTPEVDLIKYY